MYATSTSEQLTPHSSGILLWDRAGPIHKLLSLFCITANQQLWEQASKNGYPASQKATMEGLTTASGARLETLLGTDMQAGTHGYWWDTSLCSVGYKGLGSH